MSLDDLSKRLAAERLAVFGAFHPEPQDAAPKGCQTLVLIGPAEPGFWAHFQNSPEAQDGARDPLDRWSRRVIGRLACALGGKAVFPFGGPPWAPFTAWARRSGQAWQSPVGLLVQAQAGLMVSYRGALAMRQRLDLPDPPPNPCLGCAAPCLTACPVGALGAKGYDVPRCQLHLAKAEGAECLSAGCLVRRACPISGQYGRVVEQSAYHMRQFHHEPVAPDSNPPREI